MKILLVVIFAIVLSIPSRAQSIVGKWQMVKESNCMESNITVNESTENLLSEMKSRSSATPQIITFKEKQNGEESTRILGKKKGTNKSTFSYKFTGETLLILDKKSQTLTDSYTVEKISYDSLIISNASRPCETKIFLRIK
jgi:hypothetical protein